MIESLGPVYIKKLPLSKYIWRVTNMSIDASTAFAMIVIVCPNTFEPIVFLNNSYEVHPIASTKLLTPVVPVLAW